VSETRLDQGIIVFISSDVRRTANYYHNVLNFKLVEHYENEEMFAALYRDGVEIIIVQSKYGDYVPNSKRYGAGYDAYLDPEDVEGVDILYEEFKAKGVEIVREPSVTSYGSYEFLIKDIDGRLIGIGRIKNKDTFFKGVSIV